MRMMTGVSRSRADAGTCFENGGRIKRRLPAEQRERGMLKELREWELEERYGAEEPPLCCIGLDGLPGASRAGVLHW